MNPIETLTIMFADLVDSTAINVALEQTQAADLRTSLFGLLREEVERVDGRQIKSLGDGVMAVFPNASSGLAAAVAIQRRIDRLDRRFPQPIRLRIGMSAGDVEYDDGDYYGEPVIEAARLCDLADGGSILVVELVRLLAGRNNALTFGEPEPFDLKGLPDPVTACVVGWDPVELSEVPLLWPNGSEAVGAFVGRESECSRFEAALTAVEEGHSRVVALTGESGIGKSRTAEELARTAHRRGALVLAGRAREEVPVPFGAYLDALAHLVEHADQPMLVEHVAEHGAELSRLVPDLSARVDPLPEVSRSDPETELYRLYRAVLGILAEAGSARPTVLVLDDLHFADRSTLQLTRFLASEAISGLLILVIHRRSELAGDSPLHDLRAEQSRVGRLVALDLDGLGTAEVAALIEARLGRSLPSGGTDLADAISRETDGNPFFVSEVVRHLVEMGGLRADGPVVATDDALLASLPATVVEVVRRRVQRLGGPVERLLSAAAVLGFEFVPSEVAEVAGVDDLALVDGLEAAAAADLVRPTTPASATCSFAHGIVSRTLYGELSPLRRSQLHRRAAQVLRSRHGEDPRAVSDARVVAEVARHASEGQDPASTAAAIVWAREAGRRARAQLAPDEASRWFERALAMAAEVDVDAEMACELQLELGVAQRDAGCSAYRDTLREAGARAREIGSAHLLAEVALANFRGFWSASGTIDEERIEELQAARAALGGDDSPETARVLATMAVELVSGDDVGERMALADEALAMARRLDHPATLAYLLRSWELVHRLPWYLEERLAVAAEHHALAQELDDPVETFWAVNSYSIVALEHGDASLFRELVRQVLPAATATGQQLLVWIGGFVAVNAHVIRGRWTEAEALMERTHAVGQEAGMPDAGEVYASHLFEIRRGQGRVDELVDLLVAVQAAAPEIEAFRPALGICYRDLGRTDGRDLFREDVADGFARYRQDGLWLASMTMNAEIAAFFDDTEAAHLLYDTLVPWRDQVVWTGTTAGRSVAGPVALLAIALGRFEEAEDLLARAVEVHRNFGAPAWTAESLLGVASLCATRRGPGDRERAREALAESRSLASSVGAATLVRRAEALAPSL
jgi:class 3 adenylate cyclase/tetratricopeptide (TPR) repeat protein